VWQCEVNSNVGVSWSVMKGMTSLFILLVHYFII
jgi:hypothetical protein